MGYEYENWAGQFGDDYTTRNEKVDWQKRMTLWRWLLTRTGAVSVYENGCNIGPNMNAIRRLCPDVRLIGSDVNQKACTRAAHGGHSVYHLHDFRQIPGMFDLTFTAGVLIHVEPEHLKEHMQGLIDKSYQWVLAIEYAADVETEISYRDGARCWKRPYGQLYEELGLRIDDQGDASGFDRCTYWLMEKQ
jgi:hypothetical protein